MELITCTRILITGRFRGRRNKWEYILVKGLVAIKYVLLQFYCYNVIFHHIINFPWFLEILWRFFWYRLSIIIYLLIQMNNNTFRSYLKYYLHLFYNRLSIYLQIYWNNFWTKNTFSYVHYCYQELINNSQNFKDSIFFGSMAIAIAKFHWLIE